MKLRTKTLGDLPCYYVTDVVEEDAGGGNIRLWHFTRTKNVVVPLCQVVVPATKLLTIGRRLANFSESVFNDTQMRGAGQKVH